MSATSGFEGKLASIALQFRIWLAEPADTEMLAEEVSPLQLELCRLSALQLCTAVMLIQDLQSNPALAIAVASVIKLSEASSRVAAGLFMTEG